jgi:hypothetical protein
MLSVTAFSPDTVHAAHVCACLACKFVARRAEQAVLRQLTFDLAYDALRRADAICLTVLP